MNAFDKKDFLWLGLALGFFIFNLLNLTFWALGFSISPIFYGLLMPFLLWGLYKDPVRGLLTCFLFGIFVVLILGSPLFGWDARHMWFFHGKRIFLENNLYAQLDNYFPPSHNDYPALVPALAASLAKSVGFWNELYPRLSVLFVLLPVFVAMKVLLRKPALYALWISGVLIASGEWLINGYMDAILGLTLGLSCCLLCSFYKRKVDNTSYGLLILTLFTLPHIKNEGLLAALIVLLAMIPKIVATRKYWILPVLSFIYYVLIWKKPVTLAGIVTTDLFVPGIGDRFLNRITSLKQIYEIVSSVSSVSATYLFALCTFFWFLRPSFKRWAAGGFVLFSYSLALFVIYLITALDLKQHLSSSVGRTFLVVNLSTISFVLFNGIHLITKQKEFVSLNQEVKNSVDCDPKSHLFFRNKSWESEHFL